MRKEKYIDFTSDVIFKALITRNPDICKELIERCIPGIEVGDLQIETEKEVIVSDQRRRYRFDVVTRDEENIFNLEMMRYHDKIEYLLRRSQAMLDANQKIGSKRSEFMDTTIICFCTYDPFPFRQAKYVIRNRIDGREDYLYNDGRTMIVITPEGLEGAEEEIVPIVQLLKHKPGRDTFSKRIEKEVEKVKQDPQVWESIMQYEDLERILRNEGRQEGLVEGRELGLEEGLVEGRKEERQLIVDYLESNSYLDKDQINQMMKDLSKKR